MPVSINDLIKEYLNTQGFSKTAAAFEEELKSEVCVHDSVENIIVQIFQYIDEYNIERLLAVWRFMEERVFTSLPEKDIKTSNELKTMILKLYAVNCIKNGKIDKVHEFFSKITGLVRNNSEWTDWFTLPYVKNPAKDKTFEKFFSQHWQSFLVVWLHNFLSAVFNLVDKPRLVTLVEKALQSSEPAGGNDTQPLGVMGMDSMLTDDFAVIAQCGSSGVKTSTKSLRSIFKNIASKS